MFRGFTVPRSSSSFKCHPKGVNFNGNSNVFSYNSQKRLNTNLIRYTKDHEWIRVDGNMGTMGITDFAQKQLGDVVYVDLPEIGTKAKKKDTLVAVESVKAASDVYAPASGEVIEVNKILSSEPGIVNKSPTKDGWMLKLKLSNLKDLDDLLDENAYKKHVETEAH